jgi:hypothetical protein
MKESPIFTKIFELAAWLIPVTTKYPREHRLGIATQLQKSLFNLQEASIRALNAPTPLEKGEYLREMIVHLSVLTFSGRLSHKLDLITIRQYEYLAECLSEIAKLIQGWRKSVQSHITPSEPAPDS